MLAKPFFASIAVIILLPLLIFIVNAALSYFLGMETLNENNIDKLMHLLGGLSVTISSAGVLWHLVRRQIILLQDKKVHYFLVFGFLCFVVISWEILEYIIIFPIAPEYVTYSDTVTDMFCGLVGGLLGVFVIWRLNRVT